MKATDFEYRHQMLLHLLIVATAFLTYLADRDDIVWALVRDQPHPRLLERFLFAVATLLIGVGASLGTWGRAHSAPSVFDSQSEALHLGPYLLLLYPEQLGNLLFAAGLAFLAPFWGCVLLIAGEAVLVFRLIQREKELHKAANKQRSDPDTNRSFAPHEPILRLPAWGKAFREESGKWGLFLTMIVFTFLLRDRVAEVLAGASFLVWLVLNCGSRQPLTQH